jgi:ABC-type polysaccharide/polyol phosphate export permease
MQETKSLWRSWQIQRRIIHALMMREMLTRFGRHNIGFLWMFVEPMIFTMGVTILWTAFRNMHGLDLPIAAFALTGYSSVLLWRNMPGRGIGAVHPNKNLMYHRNVRLIDVFAARMLLEAAGATMSFFVLSIVFIWIEWIAPPEDILKVIFAWVLIFWFAISLATFLGILAEKTELIDKFWHPTSYLLFPLSGAAFLVDGLPKQMQDIVLWIPVTNCIEMLRDGYFGSHFTAHYDLGYVLMFNTLLSCVALGQLMEYSHRIRH